MTDGTAIAYSEREREFTFAKNGSRDVTTPISGTVFLIYSWDLLCLTHILSLKCLRLPAAMM